jgi:hypothetical protein
LAHGLSPLIHSASWYAIKSIVSSNATVSLITLRISNSQAVSFFSSGESKPIKQIKHDFLAYTSSLKKSSIHFFADAIASASVDMP